MNAPQNYDYRSFSAAAKPRFRSVAQALGYTQHSGISYSKPHPEGWHEAFNLQAAGLGLPFFYVNYGIVVPQLCPVSPPVSLNENSYLLSVRLHHAGGTGFSRASKQAISDSAALVLAQYQQQALPWLEQHAASWDSIAAEYLRVNNRIEEARLGQHGKSYGEDQRAATYGYLLLKAGRNTDALRWLIEADRLFSLPTYQRRDGVTVHAPEKHARLIPLEPWETLAHQDVKETLKMLKQAGDHHLD